MEVGAAGFERHLPLLRGRIRRAAFLAFDMEFTGLHSSCPENNEPSLFDSPVERYLKARQSVQRFTVTQLGMWCIHTTSISFLQHWELWMLNLPSLHLAFSSCLIMALTIISDLDRDVLKKAIDEVTCWIAAAEEDDTMVLHDLSGYQMFEVQLVLRQALQNVWTQPLGDKKVMVKKVSFQHRQLLENSPHDCCQKELILLSARGFTNLFQTLVKAKKPLVGHNMLMDLMHLHDKFYKPLPESYEEFKRNIHILFPVLIDTKTITKSIWKKYPFPRVSNLLEVYEVLCSRNLNPTDPASPVITLASDCSRYAEKKSPHEAGYDAFLCGSVLLKSAHLLLCRSTDDAVEADPSFSQYLTVLAEYLNKVNFIRGSVSSINFSGEDASCQHLPLLVVHVQGWPGLNERQIYQEFNAFCCFDVRRLSKNQFLLLSNKFKDIRHVLRDYKDHPHLRVSVYRHWKHSPSVNCLLQVSGIVVLWSVLAFVLGGAPCS
ncbi:poly(A)-specific ribonuclease PNLDC1 isoform X4 [Columba livia]|uniref:poly(A)-specific ribonuclease PNLDC1 isoform X4 n=1 Tax=Columba livia TaxID=8932 RepID=UPI0031B9F7F3